MEATIRQEERTSNENVLKQLSAMLDKSNNDVPFFSQAKSVDRFSIDGTSFEPKFAIGTRVSAFESSYLAQLNKLIRPDGALANDPKTVEAIVLLSELHLKISQGKFPVSIGTKKYRRLEHRLAAIWNQFYSDNISTINQIANMLGDGDDISSLFAESNEEGVDASAEPALSIEEVLTPPQPETTP